MSTSRNYYRIMLGRKSCFARECHDGEFIGGHWSIHFDLAHLLNDGWQAFREQVVPAFHAANPGNSKVTAGLSCGMLFTICERIRQGDIVLCPDGNRAYRVGEVISDYYYEETTLLPHRRRVRWYKDTIQRSDMSTPLQNSSGSIGTVCNITKHTAELEGLIGGNPQPTLISTDELVEDPSVFALEKHLEDFLVSNWPNTELGARYDIVEDEGEIVGQQYPTDTGAIDILAISKDKKEYLIVELKKGRVSDAVVGQIQRYMGFVLDELTDEGQTVRGAIIALEDDLRLRRALRVTNNIDFYRYQVSFKLFKS
ncbi:Endonuclease NucS [Pseudovibrio axinellae]|uniref:Endonuclease NucS n=1 Tax=Pseudovibrio axinellae TaxID=989403 RepID=A0A166AJT3_9HYPH|nr:endonuclease NucS domain-containing protein [Pseudovibrio axinellae]KZL21208.1 Endonuclease NucS [Pseudovibrio axinellae]SEQ92014.1 restriction system protein [Pseudovibrio axinellae]